MNAQMKDHDKFIREVFDPTETKLDFDLTIISGENEDIRTNKYLLSLFSPGLIPVLSSSCCTASTLFMPDFSTSSISNTIDIITNGFIVGDFSHKLEIIEVVKLLSVENMELFEEEKNDRKL